MRGAHGLGVLLICAFTFTAHTSVSAGVVAEEAIAVDLLQMMRVEIRAVSSVDGNKARVDSTVHMTDRGSSSADDGDVRMTEIQRPDRGNPYYVAELTRQYSERKLGTADAALGPANPIGAIASALQCSWSDARTAKTTLGTEVINGTSAAHVRLDTSRRCASARSGGHSCTLGVVYDQWS